MSIKKRVLGGLAATAMVMGLALVASPAQAIERTSYCTADVLNLVSSNTTCWQRAGYVSVVLNGVYSIIPGNNAGYIHGSNGTVYFIKYNAWSMAAQTVSAININ